MTLILIGSAARPTARCRDLGAIGIALARELLSSPIGRRQRSSARTRRCTSSGISRSCRSGRCRSPGPPRGSRGNLARDLRQSVEPGCSDLAVGGRDPAHRALARGRRVAGAASWPAWAILVLPIALAMVASAMRRYPFHGRLILELVPAFFLLIAEGTERLRELGREAGSSSATSVGLDSALRLSVSRRRFTERRASVADIRDFNQPWRFTQEHLFMT